MASIIKRNRVALRAAFPDAFVTEPQADVEERSDVHEKSVQLLREAGVVHAIEVACSCGERTVVELEYADPAPASDDASELVEDPDPPSPDPPSEEA